MERYGLTDRIDWFRIVADLNYRGIRTQAIADKVGVARMTVAGWKDGAEPKHADGEKLLDLWVTVTSKPKQYAPRMDTRRLCL